MKEVSLSELEIKIVNLIKKRNKSMTYHQLKHILEINDHTKVNELNDSLKKLELNKILYLNEYEEYQSFDKCQNINVGIVKVNKKGKVFVSTEKESIYIDEECLNGAIKGDIVLVRKNKAYKENSSKGIIKRIISRNKSQIIFDYINKEFVPYNWPHKININIADREMNIVDGSRILVDISLEKTNEKYNGKIVSVLGHKDDPDIDVKTIASNNGIIIDFKIESMNEANSINTYVKEEEIKKE